MSENGTERRHARRRKTNLKTTVKLKGSTLTCRMVNISTDGALITASFHPAVGAEVEIDLPGNGPVTATVVRVTSTYIALNFGAPVDVELAAGDAAAGSAATLAQATA